MRKLATIQQIEALSPIDGADKILKATMVGLGWECVVKKDEFNVGDNIIYCEVDSVLPPNPEFEFLKDKNYRIRTIKLKKQISQGLILPLPKNIIDSKYKLGDDVSSILGITKYLSPSERDEIEQNESKTINDKNKLKKFIMRYSWFRRLFLKRTKKQSFPYWVSKTDEERIQNIPQVLTQYKDKIVYVAEKIDYQSGTFTGKLFNKFDGLLGKLIPIQKYQFVVSSRNLTVTDKNTLYWKIAKKYNLEDILKENPNLTIQGEQGNGKVQGNKYGITEEKIWIFNIIDHEKNYHYSYDEMKSFCDKYNLTMVPLLKQCKLSELGSTVQELVEFSKGKSTLANIKREGVVIRCIENGKKILSFKVINPEFLIEYKD